MIPIFIVRKIFLFLVPLVLFYLLRKIGKKNLKRKPHLSDINKSQIVEGEIVPKQREC